MNLDVIVIINIVSYAVIFLLIILYLFFSREDVRLQRKHLRDNLENRFYSFDEVKEILVQYDNCSSSLLHRMFKKRHKKVKI